MDNNTEENKPRELTDEERKDMREGMSLYEMVSGDPGWKIINDILTNLMIHSWVDPREIEGDNPEQVWKWRELNAFHASNNAKELLEVIQKKIDKRMYLQKVASGEIQTSPMKL